MGKTPCESDGGRATDRAKEAGRPRNVGAPESLRVLMAAFAAFALAKVTIP